MPVIPTLESLVPRPAAMNYPVRTVAGVDVVDLPPRLFVMGGPGLDDAPAHWVRVSGFSIARTPVNRALYDSIADEWVREDTKDYPVVGVSAPDADRFIAEFNRRNGTRFTSPTEAEWEYAARGEVVDLRDYMEINGISEANFDYWAEGRFENLFAHSLGSTIYANPRREDFQKVLKSAARIYGYCVFGHPEGLNCGKVWWDRCMITRITGDEAEKRANSFNLIDMIGNVWEWVADRYDENAYRTLSPIDPISKNGRFRVRRVGSAYNFGPQRFRAACRDYVHDGGSNENIGFRMALARR